MCRHTCPRCKTPVSYWGHQRAQSWRLLRVLGGPFSCPNCGAVLRWSIGRWRRVQTALLVVGVILVPYLFAAGLTPGQQQWALAAFCLTAATVRIVLELLATRLVADDDGRQLQASLNKINQKFGDDLERLAQ